MADDETAAVDLVQVVGVGELVEHEQRRVPVDGEGDDRPAGHYLVYAPADPALAHLSMIFETDGQVVTTFRAGMKGAVAQIEGCS